MAKGNALYVVMSAIAPLLWSCGGADFGGQSNTRSTQGGSSAKNSDEATPVETYSIGVEYEQEEAGLSLVSNALTGYKAELIGGDDCWGDQATPFVGDPTTAVKVRKGAAYCEIVYKELYFSTPSKLTVTNATGLSTESTETKVFTDATGVSNLAVKVKQKFSVTADSTVMLSGRLLKVDNTPTATANDEINVYTKGDVVAYPNVKFASTPKTFNSTMNAIITCITKSADTEHACQPALVPAAGGSAEAQLFTAMDGMIVILKGDLATNFLPSMTHDNLDSVFANGKIGGAAQSISPKVAAALDGDLNAKFKNLRIPAFGAADKPILVVRYIEKVNGANVSAYKVFLLKL